MAVSENSGFSPKSSILIGVFHYKPSILGCFPIFGNTLTCTPPKSYIDTTTDGLGKVYLVSTMASFLGIHDPLVFGCIYMFARHNKIPSGFSCEIVFVGSCYMFRKKSNTNIWICMSCINKTNTTRVMMIWGELKSWKLIMLLKCHQVSFPQHIFLLAKHNSEVMFCFQSGLFNRIPTN